MSSVTPDHGPLLPKPPRGQLRPPDDACHWVSMWWPLFVIAGVIALTFGLAVAVVVADKAERCAAIDRAPEWRTDQQGRCAACGSEETTPSYWAHPKPHFVVRCARCGREWTARLPSQAERAP